MPKYVIFHFCSIYLIFKTNVHTNGFLQKETTQKNAEMSFFKDELPQDFVFLRTAQE
jgi:hypothetical protein